MQRVSRRGFAAAVGGALLVAATDGAPTAAAAAKTTAAKPAAVTVLFDGAPVKLVDAPLVSGDRVFLSSADLAQVFGLPVTWDAGRRVLAIGAAASAAGRGFVFQDVRYEAVGMQIRTYPGQQNTSAAYWIVQYTATNVGKQPVDVSPSAQNGGSGGGGQPSLMLIGPSGSEYTPDPNLSGPQPQTLNPRVAFSSYMVFDMPGSADPAAYAMGFNAYRVTSSGFTTTRLSVPLPPSSSATTRQSIDATYAVSGLWNSDVQEVLVRGVITTDQVVPELVQADFDPAMRFWVVEFGIDNPGPSSISFAASDFALRFNGNFSITPDTVSSLPGYVPPSDLQNGVTLGPGQVFNGALLFDVPGGTPTGKPQFVLRVNGQEQAVSAAPCAGGTCPPAQS